MLRFVIPTLFSVLCIAGPALGAEPHIIHASYGLSCDPKLHGNLTGEVRRACRGKALCRFTIDHEKHGDPAPMCKKNFVVDYNCAKSGVTKSAAIAAEATKEYVTLDCAR